MIKVFNSQDEFSNYTQGGSGMVAGDLYYVKEDESVHFRTNNIDGSDKIYGVGVGDDLVPTGNIALTENGTDIDVAEYATASVNVPIPQGYIQPSGNLEITENGEGIDVAQYATVDVNVAGGGSAVELVWEDSAVASDYNDNHMFKGLEAGKTYAIKVASVGNNNGLCLYKLYNGSWSQVSKFTSTKLVSNTPYYYTIPVAFTPDGSTYSLEGMNLAFVLIDYTQGPVAFQVAEVPVLMV